MGIYSEGCYTLVSTQPVLKVQTRDKKGNETKSAQTNPGTAEDSNRSENGPINDTRQRTHRVHLCSANEFGVVCQCRRNAAQEESAKYCGSLRARIFVKET